MEVASWHWTYASTHRHPSDSSQHADWTHSKVKHEVAEGEKMRTGLSRRYVFCHLNLKGLYWIFFGTMFLRLF